MKLNTISNMRIKDNNSHIIKNNNYLIILLLSIIIISMSFSQAQVSTGSPQTTPPSYQNPTSYQQFNGAIGADYKSFWPGINGKSDDPNACLARQDFILQIAPGSCSPSVVRSDLLESQNVPVFCPITAIKINPLIDIGEIQSVSFAGSGGLPDTVAGISFYPYRAATVQPNNLFTSPGIANIGNVLGYAVLVLKQNPNEKNMSDAVIANLTANIKYNVKKIFGAGKNEYYLSVLDEAGWKDRHSEYSFFKGNGYVRLDELSIDGSTAKISVYKDQNTILTTTTVKKGGQSEIIYLPGFYCSAGVRIKYTNAEIPRPRIKLQVDTDFLWLREGDKFLDDKCIVRSIQVTKQKENNVLNDTIARVSCPTGNYELKISELDSSVTTKDLSWTEVLRGIEPVNAQKIIENFQKAKENAYLLADLYPSEKSETGEPYGIKELQNIAETAKKLGQFAQEKEIQEKIMSKYPDTSAAENAKQRINELIKYSYAQATAFTTIDYSQHTISLVDYKKTEENEATAQFDQPLEPRRPGEYIYWEGKDNNENPEKSPNWVRVQNINVDSITIQAKTTQPANPSMGQPQPIVQTKSYVMREGQILSGVEGLVIPNLASKNDVRLNKINIKVEARIEIVPEVPTVGSSANFTFSVGIEKRGIKLSPDKTLEMIQNINESIKKWSDINEKLGKAVEAGKATCFAGSTILFIKNFIANTGGGASARHEVMRGPGGWFERCNKEKNDGKYSSVDACLSDHNTEIEDWVTKWKDGEKSVNAQLDAAYSSNPTDEKAGREKFISEFAKEICTGSLAGKQIYISSLGKSKPLCDEKDGIYTNEKAVMTAYKNGEFGVDDAREVMISAKTYDSNTKEFNSTSNSLGAQHIYGFGTNAYKRPGTSVANFGGVLGDQIDNVYIAKSADARDATVRTVEVKEDGGSIGKITNLPKGQYAEIFVDRNLPLDGTSKRLAGGVMVVPVIKSTDGSGSLSLNTQSSSGMKFVDSNGVITELKPEEYTDFVKSSKLNFKSFSETEAQCSNVYENPKVKYFTSGQYAGLPAVVPLEQTGIKKGWYVAMKDGPLSPYTEAGQVKTFWVCNVGPNGREEFDSSTADDKDSCFQVNTLAGNLVTDTFCFSSKNGESQRIIQQAQQAITQAGKYDSGKNAISIFGKSYQIEKVAASISGSQCQDFMSPSDCKIMFNLCDPVLCPTSRCDLGGAYPVDDVVQSGIVGSIALCLPNAKEGIYVPICLTGVHAGLEAYTSVLKAHRDCLQDSLNGGQKVGICDQIQSVYLCEFFWRQAAPLMKAGIPKLIEGLTTGGTRGGGEYSNIKGAFDTADKSFNYFTQVYGTNAFKAFNIRSTADVGTQVCKQFVSARYPNDANFFKNLIKPESPVQFYAEFDEIPFTEATVPPTSQYNIFYHIYAGKDQGVYYSIYLKDPPQSGLYASQPIVGVKQGFIQAGKYADEKLEMTLPSGYKQLCVNINGKEECGFRKVTTSFAINKLSEQYAAEQATSEVKTEEECINGDSSLYNSISLNIETTAGSLTNPQLYKSGITRVCSAQNPGQNQGGDTLLETTKWQRRGKCDEAGKIICWQDMTSVKDAIKDQNLENQVVGQINQEFKQLDSQQITEKLNAIQAIISNSKSEPLNKKGISITNGYINDLTMIEQQQAGISTLKARAADLRYLIYATITQELFSDAINSQTTKTTGTQITTNVADKIAQDLANAKKDCEVTGYERTKSKLNVGEQTFIKINIQGNCKNWNQIKVSLIKKSEKEDTLLTDFPVYYDIKSDETQKGYVDIRLPFDEIGIYYLNISSFYKDEKNNPFEGKIYNGKGTREFEVNWGSIADSQDCFVTGYKVPQKINLNDPFDLEISISGQCKIWNKLSAESISLYGDGFGLNYNPVEITTDNLNNKKVVLGQIKMVSGGEFYFKISPITNDLSTLAVSKSYSGQSESEIIKVDDPNSIPSIDCRIIDYTVPERVDYKTVIPMNIILDGTCKTYNKLSVIPYKYVPVGEPNSRYVKIENIKPEHLITNDEITKGISLNIPAMPDSGYYYYFDVVLSTEKDGKTYTDTYRERKDDSNVGVLVGWVPDQDCFVAGYKIPTSVRLDESFSLNLDLSDQSRCTNWNQLIIELINLNTNEIVKYNPTKVTSDNIKAKVISIPIKISQEGEYYFRISPITQDSSTIRLSKFYEAQGINQTIRVSNSEDVYSGDCKIESYSFSKDKVNFGEKVSITINIKGDTCLEYDKVILNLKQIYYPQDLQLTNAITHIITYAERNDGKFKVDIDTPKSSNSLGWYSYLDIDLIQNPKYGFSSYKIINGRKSGPFLQVGYAPIKPNDSPESAKKSYMEIETVHSPSTGSIYPIVILHSTAGYDDYLAFRWNSNLGKVQALIITDVHTLTSGVETDNWISSKAEMNENFGGGISIDPFNGYLDYSLYEVLTSLFSSNSESNMISRIISLYSDEQTDIDEIIFFKPNSNVYTQKGINWITTHYNFLDDNTGNHYQRPSVLDQKKAIEEVCDIKKNFNIPDKSGICSK